jgi:multicomponent Na+:H+ antiporter subunit C
LHSKIDNSALDHGNDLKEALKSADAASAPAGDSLHQAPGADADKISNTALSHLDKTPPQGDLQAGFDVAQGAAAHGLADAVHSAAEIIYTNPLPHVLILTAIVVGVATTAVGLALAVRIREAYGTIEEDELEAADDIAEFGHIPGSPARAGARA